ncbi:MAG: hypothetical protein OQJ97_03590 [Rhodospirillales bacterium]|nr:hypothetical protein [Rhodospirillales bacterium]
MEDYRIYRGALGIGVPTFDRIFFYHIPKTAGTSIYMAMKASGTALFHEIKQFLPSFKAPKIVRVDTPFEQMPSDLDFGFVASHLPFGAHKNFPVSFQLMTLFRHPVQRTKSAYLYECLRQDKPISSEAFQVFYRYEKNQNFMCRHLGFKKGEEVKNITLYLENIFSLIDVDGHADQVIEGMLKHNNLPNVIMKKLNKSRGADLINLEDYQDEINSLNETDHQVYDYFRENRKGFPNNPPYEPHPVTLLIDETDNKKHTGGRIYMSRVNLETEFGDETSITEDTFTHLKSTALEITQIMHLGA